MLPAAAVAMLGRGNSADPAGAAALLGRQPRGVEEMLFQQPASQAERLQAALYFFQPLFRFGDCLGLAVERDNLAVFLPACPERGLFARRRRRGYRRAPGFASVGGYGHRPGDGDADRYRIETLLMWQIGIVLAYSLFD